MLQLLYPEGLSPFTHFKADWLDSDLGEEENTATLDGNRTSVVQRVCSHMKLEVLAVVKMSMLVSYR
jgi:hypothetical protein